jgi:hypothetical protein
MAVRSFELVSGSGPPSLAAMVMFFASLGKILDILSHLASLAALRYSNARPIRLELLIMKAKLTFFRAILSSKANILRC